MLRMVPPAGTPTGCLDLWRMTRARLSSGGSATPLELKLKSMFGVRHLIGFNSGRSGMVSLLRALAARAGSERDEVIIPAYTCYSVPAAVVRAGLNVRLADVNPSDLDYHYDQLSSADLSRVLAIVSCNLFGIPGDFRILKAIVAGSPIALIDDAAQALGTIDNGVPCGCRGDAGLFSLGRGKNLSTYSGGVVLTNDDVLATRVTAEWNALPVPGSVGEATTAIKIAITSLLLHPRLYWIPDNMPFLGLGQTIYDTTFGVEKLQPLQSNLGAVLIDRLGAMNERRAAIADEIARGALAAGQFEVPGFSDKIKRNYMRLPILARDRSTRDGIIAKLNRSGIKASTMYPSTIDSITELAGKLRGQARSYPGASAVVERLLTVPTHGFVSERDIRTIVSCLHGAG